MLHDHFNSCFLQSFVADNDIDSIEHKMSRLQRPLGKKPGSGNSRVGMATAGVQIATKQIDEGIAAGLIAAQAGATWLDLNCGCPIYGTSIDSGANSYACCGCKQQALGQLAVYLVCLLSLLVQVCHHFRPC